MNELMWNISFATCEKLFPVSGDLELLERTPCFLATVVKHSMDPRFQSASNNILELDISFVMHVDNQLYPDVSSNCIK